MLFMVQEQTFNDVCSQILQKIKIHNNQQQLMTSQSLNASIRIGDEEEVGLMKKQLSPQKKKIYQRQLLGDKILSYVKSAFWVFVGVGALYYSNFFHHLFRNPKINPLFFEICIAAYTIIILLILYITFILPVFFNVKDVQEYNPKLIPIGAVTGVVAVVSLLIAIWPVWGWSSLLLFICLWKGFFALSMFLPGGQFGNLLFLIVNAGIILSFYIIEHEGYFH